MQFNPAQIHMVATLSANMAQVSVASVVVPYFLDTFEPFLALLGLVAACFFSAVSLIILSSHP